MCTHLQGKVKDPKGMQVCMCKTNGSKNLFTLLGENFSKKYKIPQKKHADKAEIQVKLKTREQKKHDFDHFRTNVIETGCIVMLNKMSYLVM